MTHSKIYSFPVDIDPHGESSSWQDFYNLLKLVRNDYQGAILQLDKISQHLSERELLVNQYLQHAFISSHGFRTLCLYDSKTGAGYNQIGNIVLGGTANPAKIPLPAQIEVHSLGRFEIRSALKQINHWDSIKAKSILQLLLLKPGELTLKDTLMEALWPECTSRAANNNLKAAMHSLRHTLGTLLDNDTNQNLILFSQGSYRINPEFTIRIDVEEFEKAWANGRRLEREHNIVDAIREYEKADLLYRGDYLEDEPYEEWTLLRREALKDKYLFVISRLADCHFITADYESSIHYSQKILSKDCCREDAYRRLIKCYSKLGQRNRALRWYEICCRTIKTELDTLPEDETTALLQKI